MKVLESPLPGLLVIEPNVFGDSRGFFFESYNERSMRQLGIPDRFVQDNFSFSAHNVLRGMHYQIRQPQGKLVRVITGEILDIAVDLRRRSPTFGRWTGVHLSGENKRAIWLPVGFAHGFRVVSNAAHVMYKTTDFYAPEFERTIRWDDPQIGIDWNLDGEPIISAKDQAGVTLENAEVFE